MPSVEEERGGDILLRRKYVIISLQVLVLAFSLAFPMGALAGKPQKPVNWLAEISKYIDVDYTRKVMEDLVALGSSSLGFRATGTRADFQAVNYIVNEMEKIGLQDVDKEEVPVDAWEFKGASLTVKSPVQMEIEASSFAGVQGTGRRGITGELVFVGSSYSSDYEGLDVEGKIVLSNWDGYNIWIDALGQMAYLRGAVGVVASCMDSIYGQGPYALQCHDSNWKPDVWPPLIYIPKEYGLQLVDMLENGEEVIVTMKSNIDLDLDSTGYNTIGYIPGKNFGSPDDEFIIIGDHEDAWFTGAGDDTSGVATMLALAKAVMDSGYQPERTMVFTTHTAEEFGTVDVYYDWCVGAWYQITREHPDWAGKSVAYLNLESMGQGEGPFVINTPVDLNPFLSKVARENAYLMPYGVSVVSPGGTWDDGWTFTAAGVPGITTWTVGTGELSEENIYHTQLDNMDTIDFDYMRPCVHMNLAIVIGLDQGPVIPYNFDARASDFLGEWNERVVASTGVDSDLVEMVTDAAIEFKRLSNAWDLAKTNVDTNEVRAVNKILLETIKVVEDGLTAMDVWEETVYPHQQALTDCVWIQSAIDSLKDGVLDSADDAMWDLKGWVGTVWYYDYVDYEYYRDDAVTMHTPDNWGEQVQLGAIVDTWDVIVSLEEKKATGNATFADERAMLQGDKEVALQNLEDSLYVLLTTFTEANALLQQIT